MSLRDTLLGRAPANARPALAALTDLEARLDALLGAARTRWPELALPDDGFVAHLAALLPEEEPVQALGLVRAEDLFLAFGCSRGDARAVEAFRRTHLSGLRAALARLGPAHVIEETIQQVLVRLIAGKPEERVIARYAGRGSLASWVQTLAVRMALAEKRKKQATPSDELDALVDRAVATDDPELRALKRTYREQFKDAFGRALAALSSRDRNLLRYECLDQLTLDEIALVYGVHRGTIARWRASARAELFDGTRRIFREELKVSPSEFDSILRLIESQYDVSLVRLLEDEPRR